MVVSVLAAAITLASVADSSAQPAPTSTGDGAASTTAPVSTAPTTPPSTTAPSLAPTSTASTLEPFQIRAEGGKALFPGLLVGPIPAADVPVERAVTDVFVTPTSKDPDRPNVAVQFRSPFPFPAHPYRISVLVGDPHGARLRASLIDTGNGVASWRAERSTALPPSGPPAAGAALPESVPSWQVLDSQPNGADFSPTGLAVIAVPLNDAPAGGDVWVEVESGSDGTQVNTSPLFARAALFAPTPPGYPLPSSTTGQLTEADGTSTGQLVTLPDGPTVALAGHDLKVTTTERPPTQLAGQRVTKVVDVLRIAATYDTRGVVTDYVSIDRTTGEVRAFDGTTLPPTDRTGDASWLTTGLSPGDPATAGTMQIDLDGVARALGIELAGTTSGIGIRRQFVLADGRQIVAEGVLGTLVWFDANAAADFGSNRSTPDGAPLGPVADTDSSPSWIGRAIGGVLALLVLIAVVAAIVLRRRRRAAAGDAADSLTAIAIETAEHRAITREERRLSTADVPVVDEAVTQPPATATAGAEAVEPAVEPATAAEEDDPLESPLYALVDLTDHGPTDESADVKRDPADVLASLNVVVRRARPAPPPHRGAGRAGRRGPPVVRTASLTRAGGVDTERDRSPSHDVRPGQRR